MTALLVHSARYPGRVPAPFLARCECDFITLGSERAGASANAPALVAHPHQSSSPRRLPVLQRRVVVRASGCWVVCRYSSGRHRDLRGRPDALTTTSTHMSAPSHGAHGLDVARSGAAQPQRTPCTPPSARTGFGSCAGPVHLHLRLVRSIIPFSPGGATTANSNTTVTTVSPQMPTENIPGVPHMANTLHPIEAWILKRRTVRKMALAAFLEDGHLSEKERLALDMIAIEDETVIEYRAREVAADSYKRNGMTDLTRRRFHDAGAHLIDLDAERRERRSNVVAFPNRQNAG